MIDIAFGLQHAVRDAVNTDKAVSLASAIVFEHQQMDEELMKQTLLALVGEVASMASFFTAEVCLGEEGFETLNETINELMEFEGEK